MNTLMYLSIFIMVVCKVENSIIKLNDGCGISGDSRRFYRSYFNRIKTVSLLKLTNCCDCNRTFIDDFVKMIQTCDNFKIIIKDYCENSTGIAKVYDHADIKVIIVENLTVLHYYLEESFEIIATAPRGKYIIFITTNLFKVDDIRHILREFWYKRQLLNVLIQIPCYQQNEYIFTYDPFYRNVDNTWGVLRVRKLKDFINRTDLIHPNLNNLNGYPVKVAIFERFPTTIKLNTRLKSEPVNSNVVPLDFYGGVDGNIVLQLSKKLNFSIELINNTEANHYGTTLENGTATGSLSLVVNRIADLSGNGRFINDLNNKIEYTTPFGSDQVCIIVPKSLQIPHWMHIFNCFKFVAWIAILINVIVSIIFWYFYKIIKTNRRNFSDASFEIIALTFQSPINLRNKRNFFICAYLTFNVIINGIFQGNLINAFTSNRDYKDIDTLEELDQSGLKIVTSLNIFGYRESELFQNLNKKIVSMNVRAIDRTAFYRDSACVERRNDAKIHQLINLNKFGLQLIHIVNECPIYYYFGFIVPKNSPYLLNFDDVLIRLFTSGLTKKWYSEVTNYVEIKTKYNHTKDQQAYKTLTAYDMQSAFFILILGLSLAIICFLLEICVFSK